MKKNIISLAIFASLALPTYSYAGRIINSNYPHDELKKRGICQTTEECNAKRIYLDNGTRGIQANYNNESELVDLITRLYIRNTTPENLPTTTYFISENPKIKKGKAVTFFDTFGLFDKLNFNGHKRAYNKIETLIESDDFQSCIKREGEDKCFIQGINPRDKINIGFFNYEGKQID